MEISPLSLWWAVYGTTNCVLLQKTSSRTSTCRGLIWGCLRYKGCSFALEGCPKFWQDWEPCPVIWICPLIWDPHRIAPLSTLSTCRKGETVRTLLRCTGRESNLPTFFVHTGISIIHVLYSEIGLESEASYNALTATFLGLNRNISIKIMRMLQSLTLAAWTHAEGDTLW